MAQFTHFDQNARKSNPKAALARVGLRDAQGYGNQRKHDLRIGAQPNRRLRNVVPVMRSIRAGLMRQAEAG